MYTKLFLYSSPYLHGFTKVTTICIVFTQNVNTSPYQHRQRLHLIHIFVLFQVIIFVKSVQRCIALSQLLVEQNFPAIAIHRAMTQDER